MDENIMNQDRDSRIPLAPPTSLPGLEVLEGVYARWRERGSDVDAMVE